MRESARWCCDWTIVKFADTDALQARSPYAVEHIAGNAVTFAGLARLWSLVTGQGGETLSYGHARIGVGSGTAATGAGDTNLSGPNRWFQVLDGAPTVNFGQLKVSATFQPGDASFAWNEFGIDIGSGGAAGNTVAPVLFNHRSGVGGGVKPADQAWIAQVLIGIA